MIGAVYVWLAAIGGLVVGAVVTWLVGRALDEARHPVDTLATDVRQAVVEPEVKRVMALLKGAGVIVGPHDEVLHSTVAARSQSLTRGTRIADQEVLDLVRSSREDGAQITSDLDLDRGPGRTVQHLTVRVGPLDDHGNVVLLTDDRAPLLRAEQTRRDFVANISHELKTPIGAVAILSEAIEGAADDPDSVRHFAGRLIVEVGRLSELVKQIINLSRLQSDEPLLTPEQVDVDRVLRLAVDRNRELAGSREVNLVLRTEPDLVVLGDADQLTDAVSNLVHNAIVYSDRRARVAVSSRLVRDVDQDEVEIVVADNGIGISDDDQKRIFERFYRVDYARSRDNGGTGLGLSLVKHIAQVHGGAVDVWSKVGQGSTFTLSLPVPEPTPDAEDEIGIEKEQA